MKNALLALGLLAGLASAVDVKVSDTLEFTVHCETSDISPYLHHIYEAANQVHTDPEAECYQNSVYEPYCTKIEESKGGRIAICDSKGERVDIGCRQVADMARAVADNCSNGVEGAERAGGWVEEWKLTINGWEMTPAWVEVSVTGR